MKLDHLPPWDGDDYILGLSVSVTVKGEVEEQVTDGTDIL